MIYLADPVYNPNFVTDFTSATKLGRGITMGKFLGSRGTRTQLIQLTTDIPQLARNLYLHAELLTNAKKNPDFGTVRITVSEGVYLPAINETPSGVNKLKVDGRAVVYQVINKKGKTDIPKTYDLANYWKDYADYDRLSIDYDTYDPSGELTAQLVVEMPMVPETFDLQFKSAIDTYYNGELQSKNELIEILE